MKKNSLNVQIWKYLMLFSILILVFLWTFQVLFLDTYYKSAKTNDIKKVAEKIKKNQNNNQLESLIQKLAYEKDVCIEIINTSTNIFYSSEIFRGCLTGDERSSIYYKNDFMQSEKNSATFSVINPRENNQTLIHAIKLDHGYYAFVNTSIEPVNSTVNILTKQLIYVTLLVLILAFTVAYFISKHISNPIVKINKAAKRLGNGEFNVVFDPGENIKEINELAETLSYTRDEMQKTDELRRDLMANVSHDLKTPLTMIKAYAEMIRDLNSNNKMKREENIKVILEEVDRLTILVNDILDLSKMQSEIDHLNYSDFDLHELIKMILKRYEIFRDTEDYKFEYHGIKNLKIKADKKKIEQVIYNLINNAINYTGKDNLVSIHVMDKQEYYRIEIIDTGKGIKKEDIPYIWDKYYKNEKKHKRNIVGTGLGLSIVKNILQLHQYQYGVNSEIEKGTTFYFEIKKDV